MEELEERLAVLEREHEELSERVELQVEFLMAALLLIAEDEARETLRGYIDAHIEIARKAGLYDRLNHLQDLRRTFQAAPVLR